MVRSILRRAAGVLTALGFAMMVLSVVGVPFGFAQAVPTCELSGDFVIDLFDGTALRSDLDDFAASNGPFEANLPAGRYSVHLQSFDRHSTETTSAQTDESWFVRGLDPDGMVIWESNPIDDLPEDRDAFAQTVDPGSDVPGLAQVVAVHAAFPDTSSTNSVQALCVAFIIEQAAPSPTVALTTAAEPTTTLQAPTTTAAATTSEATTTTQATTTEASTTSLAGTSASEPATAQGVQSGVDTTGAAAAGAAGDDSTNVLGAQIDQDNLPLTGPLEDALAVAGAVMFALGSVLLLALREDKETHHPVEYWT